MGVGGADDTEFGPDAGPPIQSPEYAAIDAAAAGRKVLFEVGTANPIVPIDAGRYREFCGLGRARLVQRLHFAAHYMACRLGRTHGTVSLDRVATWLWGEGRRPQNWRPLLTKAVQKAVELHRSGDGKPAFEAEVKGDRDMLSWSIAGRFLGALGEVLTGERLERVTRISFKVTDEHLQAIWSSGHWDRRQYTKAELLSFIADRRRHLGVEARTLQQLGRERRVRQLFVPAVLGDPDACRQVGDVAALLVDHLTRHTLVRKAQVVDFAGRGTVACPLLATDTVYNAFAGNGNTGPRPAGTERRKAGRGWLRGRGYGLASWARMAELTEDELLRRLADTADRLQLVVVGIGRDNVFYDLQQIIAASPAVRERISLRVYTPEGFQTRWSDLLGWRPERTDGENKAQHPPGDLPVVRTRALEYGVRKLAGAVGLHASTVSRALSGEKKIRRTHMAAIRRVVFEGQPPGGPDAAHLFEGCSTPLHYALAYRRLQLSIVPMQPRTKIPYISWKQYQSCLATEEEITTWFTTWPDAALGLVLGPVSGIFGIDSDTPEAADVLAQHCGGIPADCPMVRSGSNRPYKFHLYFRHPPQVETAATFEPWVKGLEFRGSGGLLVLPPSLHKSGNRYTWEPKRAIGQMPLPDVPAPVLAALEARQGREIPCIHPPVARPGGVYFDDATVGYSGRRFSRDTRDFLGGVYIDGPDWNKRTFRAAQELRDYGMPLEEAERVVLRGAGPYDDRERAKVVRTVHSAYSWTPMRLAR